MGFLIHSESRLSKREIIRRLGVFATQFYRLLDESNDSKSVDQLAAPGFGLRGRFNAGSVAHRPTEQRPLRTAVDLGNTSDIP